MHCIKSDWWTEKCLVDVQRYKTLLREPLEEHIVQYSNIPFLILQGLRRLFTYSSPQTSWGLCFVKHVHIIILTHFTVFDDFLIDKVVKLDVRIIYFTKYFPYVWTNIQTSKWLDTKCLKLMQISWLIIGIHWEPRKYRPKNESLQCCVFE